MQLGVVSVVLVLGLLSGVSGFCKVSRSGCFKMGFELGEAFAFGTLGHTLPICRDPDAYVHLLNGCLYSTGYSTCDTASSRLGRMYQGMVDKLKQQFCTGDRKCNYIRRIKQCQSEGSSMDLEMPHFVRLLKGQSLTRLARDKLCTLKHLPTACVKPIYRDISTCYADFFNVNKRIRNEQLYSTAHIYNLVENTIDHLSEICGSGCTDVLKAKINLDMYRIDSEIKVLLNYDSTPGSPGCEKLDNAMEELIRIAENCPSVHKMIDDKLEHASIGQSKIKACKLKHEYHSAGMRIAPYAVVMAMAAMMCLL